MSQLNNETQNDLQVHLNNTTSPCEVRLFSTNNGKDEKDLIAKPKDTVVKAMVEVKDDKFDLSKKVNGKYVNMLALMEYITTDDRFQTLVETQDMELADSPDKFRYSDSSIFNYDKDANKPKNIVCLTFSSSLSF